MALREELEISGNWLFRRRSYLPFLIIFLAVLALRNFKSVYPDAPFHPWEWLCLAVSLSGVALRVYTVACVPRGTSGRNTQSQVAETLNTTGVYSVVRHPLYVGNFLVWMGVVASVRSWWFVTVAALLFWIYYERIMFAEEEFLRGRFGESYLAWARRTPAFFIDVRGWRAPERAGNLLAGLGSEYATIFMVITTFTVLNIVENRLVRGRFLPDGAWTVLFISTTVLYLIVRTIKKQTKMLNKK